MVSIIVLSLPSSRVDTRVIIVLVRIAVVDVSLSGITGILT